MGLGGPPSVAPGLVAVERYDLELFERLNLEYREKPISPEPLGLDPQSRARRARRKLRKLSRQLGSDLGGRRVLEIGCAHGQLTSLLARQGGAKEAIGVDVKPSPAWTGTRTSRCDSTLATSRRRTSCRLVR